MTDRTRAVVERVGLLKRFFKKHCPHVRRKINSCVAPLCDHFRQGGCRHPERPGEEGIDG